MGETPTIERAYRMRVYPTRRQRALLARLLGATRYVWNWGLARRTEAYRCDRTRLDWVALSREFTALREAEGTQWLGALPREPFTQVVRDLEQAFKHFFEQRAAYPRFKRRGGGKCSVRFTLDQRREQREPCPKGVRLALSHRRARTRARIARLHARIADQRRDTLHRATTAIVCAAQVIAIESLRVKALSRGMGRRAFRRSIADAALGEVRRQLTYKGAWAQRQVVAVDVLFPSSKRCSMCHEVNRALRLERTWCCATCGSLHERDENAAKNLRQEGLRLRASGSPATGKRLERQARGVACVAEGEQQATAVLLQCRPTMNREPAPRSARTETARASSGTARCVVRAGL
jgi:IS605 OrfB family transposase